MSKIHLQGLGVVGSLLALKLHQQGQRFTWNDIEAPINAWQASTGTIYPSGDPVDTWSYEAWLRNYFGELPEFCSATYCFLSKRPPHGGKYPFELVGPFGIASHPSFHLNAQVLVPRVRKQFADCRVEKAPAGALTVVTHGFGQRLERYLWGWAVKVRLNSRHDQVDCYYMRVGRFKLAYAYPIPLEPGWFYAGSSLISQRHPRELNIAPKFENWKRHVKQHTGLRVMEQGAALQGWRPVAAKTDTPLLRKMNGQWVIRPQWSSGIRHAPGIVETLLGRLL